MNKSFNEAGLQFVWDSTSLKLAEECPRKYKYVMIDGWQATDLSVHLNFGALYATALEHYHKARAQGIGYDDAVCDVVREALVSSWVYNWTIFDEALACDDYIYRITGTIDNEVKEMAKIGEGSPWESGHNLKTRETLIRTIVWYLDQFQNDNMSTIILADGKPAVELSFLIPISDDLFLSGHMDRLVEYSGDIFVTDNKTTGSTISARYFDGWNPDIQMCQPRGTLIQTKTGTIPIEDIVVGDEVISFHSDLPVLRKKLVIGKAERPFSGYLTSIAVKGTSHLVTPNHRVLMRYTEDFKSKFAVYIMRKGNNYRIGTVQIATKGETGINGISQRCRSEKADAMWVLDIFNSRKEAWLVEQLIGTQYGLSQATFKAGNFKCPDLLEDDQQTLDVFWEQAGNNVDRAKKALTHFGRLLEYPLYTTEENDAFDSSRAQMVRACNILPGVTKVPVIADNEVEWLEADIAYEPYKGMVYSLEVEKTNRSNYGGCYIANGIVTGNSMYTFAGKMIYHMPISGVVIDAAQIAVGFTRFERGFTFRSTEQLDEWYDQVQYLIEETQAYTKAGYFPMRTSACGNYGGCRFRDVCSRSPSVRDNFLRAKFIQGPTWDPAARR